MTQPLMSVIIPTFNRQHCLPRAVASVLQQSYTHWDLWVIDDGSTDETEAWVKGDLIPAHPDKKIFYVKTLNKGVSAARNLAIQKSQGEWLAFLDSDDEWLPEKLEKQWEVSKALPECPLIHGEEIWVRRGQRVNPKKKHQKSGGSIFSSALALCCISPSTALIKRSLFNEVGLFREDFPVCEDYELWLRVTSRHPVGFVTDPVVVKYGGHEDQLSRKYIAMDYWRLLAMRPFLNDSHLGYKEKELTAQEIIKKSGILLKGYIKHNNLRQYDEILHIQQEAKGFLKRVTHPTAD